MFCKNFLSLTDCLIAPNFDVETFLLLVLVSLESKGVELGLRLEAVSLLRVTPLRTKDVEAKEEQLELFCTEIHGFWLG